MDKDIDFIVERLGFDRKSICENKSRSIKGTDPVNRILSVYDIKKDSGKGEEPYASVVVNTRNRNNKIAIAIGSNPKDPNKSLNKNGNKSKFKVRLEPTRLNSLIASNANYLVQFDITNVPSWNNDALNNQSKASIKDGTLLSLSQLKHMLKYLNCHQKYYETILAYGEKGYDLLAEENFNAMKLFAKTIRKYGNVIEQFILPMDAKTKFSDNSKVLHLFPSHASYVPIAGYRCLDRIDDTTLDNYLRVNNK